MPANLDNCVFALAPASWGKGNAPASFNIGDIPIYPDGVYSPCVLTNCAEGYGLVNNGGDCYYGGDGNNDHVLCPDILELNSVPKVSLEMWVWQNIIDQTDFPFWKSHPGSHLFQINTTITGAIDVCCRRGDNSLGKINDYSLFISAMSWHHIMIIFDGALVGDANRLKIFIDSAQITLAFSGAPIAALTGAMAGVSTYIGGHSGGGAWDGRIGWTAVYSDADTSRPAQNFAMGRDMGLIGISIGNNMKLVKDICCIRKRRGIV